MNLEGYPKTLKLRDGRSVVIRPLVPKDAPGLLAFYRALPKEDRQFLDDDVTTKEWVDRYIARVDYDTLIPMVADYGSAIAGHSSLIRTHFGWMSHVGQLRLVVARDFQRCGLGTSLLKEMVRIGINAGLEKITARMMDTQLGAMRAFKRVGFKQDAIFKNYVKDTNGRRRNLIIMGNDVSHIWQAMESLVEDFPRARG